VMPVFAVVMMFFAMANVAMPGASSFVAEIMVLLGTFNPAPEAMLYMPFSMKWVAIVAASSVILSACYTLWMVKRVLMGDLVKDEVKELTDMNVREFAFFAPLIVLVIWLGLYPVPALDLLHASVAHLVDQATSSKLADAALLAEGAAAHLTGH